MFHQTLLIKAVTSWDNHFAYLIEIFPPLCTWYFTVAIPFFLCTTGASFVYGILLYALQWGWALSQPDAWVSSMLTTVVPLLPLRLNVNKRLGSDQYINTKARYPEKVLEFLLFWNSISCGSDWLRIHWIPKDSINFL